MLRENKPTLHQLKVLTGHLSIPCLTLRIPTPQCTLPWLNVGIQREGRCWTSVEHTLFSGSYRMFIPSLNPRFYYELLISQWSWNLQWLLCRFGLLLASRKLEKRRIRKVDWFGLVYKRGKKHEEGGYSSRSLHERETKMSTVIVQISYHVTSAVAHWQMQCQWRPRGWTWTGPFLDLHLFKWVYNTRSFSWRSGFFQHPLTRSFYCQCAPCMP